MHNGGISEFPLVKRKLQAVLSDEIFHVVQGNTGVVEFSVTNLSC